MLTKSSLPVIGLIAIMMLFTCASCNNVGSNTADVQIYAPEESHMALKSYIVENADGSLCLNYDGEALGLEPSNRIVPTVRCVKEALAKSGFYNEGLFEAVKIYLMPYEVPSKFESKYVGGFITNDEEIVLFTINDRKDLQRVVLHELGHIAADRANKIDLEEYSRWRLEGKTKNTWHVYEMDDEIVVKEDGLAKHVLKPDEVIAEDFSLVYGSSLEPSQYEGYLDSPLTDPKLKSEIKMRLDKLFDNQKKE